MASRIIVTVTPRAGEWEVVRGSAQTWTRHRTQQQAISAAVAHCRLLRGKGQLLELRIKGRNGRIRDSRTYGRDPRRTPG